MTIATTSFHHLYVSINILGSCDFVTQLLVIVIFLDTDFSNIH